jgi:energy-coupling factor transporter ATP-binding protein EcfA2
MKINKLELKNFKRFDDLTIDLSALPTPPKLVLLIGTNGSGKSSVFDVFELINKFQKGFIGSKDGVTPSEVIDLTPYYTKNSKTSPEIKLTTSDGVWLYNNPQPFKLRENAFYGRTSFRQTPKLLRTTSGTTNVSFENDSDRPRTFIDHDNRFENDIEKVSASILTDVFGKNSTEKIFESYINPINRAFENIFSHQNDLLIKLISIKPPLDGKIAEILFEKGNSLIPYDYLSSGEKEVFNILLDLLVRREYFTDSVYFFDEIDLHLNTALQKGLIKEITENWVNDNCQIWAASHSLGFIEYANESANAAIIDFDSLNFDVPQIVYPSTKNNFDVFEIAVSKDFLSNVFEGKRIIFSENTDTPKYNNLNIKDTIFFNGLDKQDVFYKAKNYAQYYGLIDRDYLTDEEIEELRVTYKNLYILKYYSIENYLYHPDNLEEYFKTQNKEFNKSGYIEAILIDWLEIKLKISIGINGARNGYPFFKENDQQKKLEKFKKNTDHLIGMIESDDFETIYKIYPAKDYGKQIKERMNINRDDLAKTQWFKTKIEELLS